MNEKTNKHIIDILFVIALFAIFVLSAVFLISIGANIYTKTMSNMDHCFNSRTAVAYITEKVRQSDEEGSIHIGTFERNNAIIITSTINGKEYTTYIYEYGGSLMELMVRSNLELSPSAGQKLLDVDTFNVTSINPHLAHVTMRLNEDEDYDFYFTIHSGGLNNV